MMKICRITFNIYLLALAGMALGGCATAGSGSGKKVSTLRFHYVINPDGTERCLPIAVFRASPMKLHIDRSPFLHEGHIKKATVTDHLGSYGIQVEFDHKGSLILDSVTVAERARRIAIYSDFGESRWLTAPLLTHRITNGVFNFTPDASREEAERIVNGLNYLAKKNK